MIRLASLFDGIGGAPLCALMCGAAPVWASEIEKFPIRVTEHHFPTMKHYGDIAKINGSDVEPVHIVVGGSPCQDLSVAGKRAGLAGGRSGLFMEQIRIIKEMRQKYGADHPRFMVWENVPGAFSSNGGEDFRAVLEETARIADPAVSIPRSVGGWANAGSILADGWSLSWRTLDAQYWGVPQRRRRIYLVADFTGQSAPKILFESEGLSGYSAEGFRAWQGTACCAENCADKTGIGYDGYNGSLTEDKAATLGVNCGTSTGRNGVVLNDQGGNRMDITNDMTSTLRAEAHHPPCVMESAGFCTEHSAKARSIGYEEEMSPTLRAGVVPAAVANVLLAKGGLYFDVESDNLVINGNGTGIAGTLDTHYGDKMGIEDQHANQGCPNFIIEKSVRRLTPLECERLQGYPDGWTDIPGASDSARYKALGNSFAIPCAYFVISGCVEELRK